MKARHCFLFTVLLSSAFLGAAQIEKRIDSLNTLSMTHRRVNPDTAYQHALKALELSQTNGLTKKEFESIRTLCITCYHNQWFERSIPYCQEAFNFPQDDDNLKIEPYILHGLSNVHLARYNEAISSFLAYLEIGRRNKDDRLVGDGLANLGLAYLNDGNLLKAAEYYRASLRIQKKFDNTAQLGYTYQNYARIMMDLAKYDSAEFYFDSALSIADELNDGGIKYWVYAYMEYLPKYSNQQRIEMKQKALDLAYQGNMGHEIAGMNHGLAEIIMQTKEYGKSISYSEEAIKYGQKMGNFQLVLRSLNLLAQAMANLSRYEESRFYLSRYEFLKDSLSTYDIETFESIMGANELITQEREIEHIQDKLNASEAVNRQNQIALIGAIVFILLIGIILFMSINANRNKTKNNLELKSLNEKLDAAIKEKDVLAGMIVHDIRSPFNKIEALMQLFQMDEEVSKNQKEIMDTMMSVIDDSRVLTNELLEINKIEAGKVEVKKSSIDLKKFVDEQLLQFESAAAKKGIHLTKEVKLETRSINSSKNILQRIVENLVSNAIKYTPIDGNVHVSVESDLDQLKIVVKDDGPGIPHKEQGLLFKKFGRASSRPTADEVSTGLGLYIVEKMCGNLEGVVTLNSQEGEGAEFIVKIPLE